MQYARILAEGREGFEKNAGEESAPRANSTAQCSRPTTAAVLPSVGARDPSMHPFPGNCALYHRYGHRKQLKRQRTEWPHPADRKRVKLILRKGIDQAPGQTPGPCQCVSIDGAVMKGAESRHPCIIADEPKVRRP